MKTRRPIRTRLWVEELEPRVVLSPVFHNVESTNWSGYSIQASNVSVVSGSWTVPSATGANGSYSSFWVGIDGYSSNSVEQIGTDSDIQGGRAVYYAWYEMYPNPSYKISLTIHAGDKITASVTYSAPSTYTLSLTDTTTGKGFSTNKTLAGAANSSAEWIAEAPSSYSGVLPLADFGTVNFSNASATVNGVAGPIDGSSPYTGINMVTPSGALKATTSALNADTTVNGVTTSSFSVTWNSSGATSRHHGLFGGHMTNGVMQGSDDTAPISINPSAGVRLLDLPPVPLNAAAFTPPASAITSSAFAPALSALAANGPRAGVQDPDPMVVDDDLVSIWLPGNAPIAPAGTQSFAEVVTTPQRQPALVPNAEPMPTAPLAAPAVQVEPPAPAPTPEPESAPGLVANTFSKAIWLAGALGFIAHNAFVGKSQRRDEDKKEGER
jgi:Peptidase A4 family